MKHTFLCRYRNSNHKDFVPGICWQDDSKLFSCSWDSKVIHHDVSSKSSSINSADSCVTKIETKTVNKNETAVTCNGDSNAAVIQSSA